MKILIIAANREQFPSPVFPLGASYISHSLTMAGHEVHIFDGCTSTDVYSQLTETINDFDPAIIGISMRNVDNIAFPIAVNYLEYYKKLMDVCRANSSARIILGGSGFSIFPELYMKELQPDFGIKGEGEKAVVELVKDIEENRTAGPRLISSTNDKDLHFDSYPSRAGFDPLYYFNAGGCINIQTKRGCSFTCSYCTYPLIEGSTYRFRKVSGLVDEIQYWQEHHGLDYVFFVDSVFNYPEKYARSICEEIIRRNLKVKWTGFFIPRFDQPDFLDVCLESGLQSIDFGTDAFSAATLKGFAKHFTVDDIFASCQLCSTKGIIFNHSLIVCGPGETYATLEETISNTNKTNPTSVITFIGARLYAGTPLAHSLPGVSIGIDPVFYISEEVKEGILDFLQNKVGENRKWIIPGMEKGVNLHFSKKIRKQGVKGPLWEILSRYE